MTDKRTLVRSKGNGVEVWGCNACEWARPRRRMIAGGTERREDLHAAFHQHNCEDYPGPRRLAGSTAQVHLYADDSGFASGDQLQFTWTLSYAGTDPAGKSIQLAPCTGVAKAIADQHQCFYAGSPGTYTVTLSITETASGPPSSSATSNTDTAPVPAQ